MADKKVWVTMIENNSTKKAFYFIADGNVIDRETAKSIRKTTPELKGARIFGYRYFPSFIEQVNMKFNVVFDMK